MTKYTRWGAELDYTSILAFTDPNAKSTLKAVVKPSANVVVANEDSTAYLESQGYKLNI